MEQNCLEHRILDIRKFPVDERNFRVLSLFESIGRHCSFIVVTDQDPVSLHKEFEGELHGRFLWENIQNGPSEWKFLITKI